jgi:hypothetical protein
MKLLRITLQCVGLLTLLVVAALAIYIYSGTQGRAHKVVNAREARFVLAWAGFGTLEDWKLVDGQVSARNPTGDHTDYYCIQLGARVAMPVSAAEWTVGPEHQLLYAAALESALSWGKNEGGRCLPSFDQANSSAMKVRFWRVSASDRNLDSAQVLILDPVRRRLYFVSFAT